jgi:hypothetical protein
VVPVVKQTHLVQTDDFQFAIVLALSIVALVKGKRKDNVMTKSDTVLDPLSPTSSLIIIQQTLGNAFQLSLRRKP